MKKTFSPKSIEQKWYKEWEASGYFNADPKSKKPSFSIMIPPPNTTGSLHMGHGFQNTLMDALIRHKRMSGYDALWQVGTDHAGIVTQIVVERELEKEGLTREGLGREKFIDRVWEWKNKSGNNITNQLRRLGASVDWSREAFTMSPEMSTAVQEVFIRLYDQGLIYRGKRMVNWDIVLQTALSDLEVSNEEGNGSLWFFKYPMTDKGHITIATTRPETMLGDTAVAVNPKDKRFNKLIGKKVALPLSNREIPIIGDTHVDPEFGTGCVKITPAHDFNDFDIGQKHKLPSINILNLDGTLNNEVPHPFQGLKVLEARKKVIQEMDGLKLLEKIEPYKTTIPRGDRSNSILEPLLTYQWFLDVKKMSKVAIKAVKKGETEFVPKNWENTYFAWMNDIQDWCISRQIWWGHRIPAWLDDEGNIFVAENEKKVREKYGLDSKKKITQEEDVLDTWFSSALWTFSTLGWPSKDNLLKKYHPTNVLVTGFDIIFFWVARMIMMTTHFISEVPFKKVFIHGLVKDSEGQKMSKSKGNILDPLDIIDGISTEALIKKRTEGLLQPKMKEKIEKQTIKEFPEGIQSHGTDALRLTYCSLASGSRDVNFDMKRVEGYRNFCNKLWNAARFIKIQLADNDGPGGRESKDSPDLWIKEKLNETSQKVNSYFEEFRFDLVTLTIYDFIWNEFCDWYIEICKIRLSSKAYGVKEKRAILQSLISTLEKSLRLAHPIMPFITEELWQQFKSEHKNKSLSIMISEYPNDKTKRASKEYKDIEWVKEIISGIRNIRGEMRIKPSVKISALLQQGDNNDKRRSKDFEYIISELSGLGSLEWHNQKEELPASAINFHKKLKVLIPLEGLIKAEEEKNRIEKNILKLTRESESISKQLKNKKFINNAPKELVSNQKKRFQEISQELNLQDIQIQEIQKLL
ncbi:MAG: valine--tRNA ligase [SAR86 cluster bacterium]|nr:valine--tRNA ligase [SAR86 cluster bacterium]